MKSKYSIAFSRGMLVLTSFLILLSLVSSVASLQRPDEKTRIDVNYGFVSDTEMLVEDIFSTDQYEFRLTKNDDDYSVSCVVLAMREFYLPDIVGLGTVSFITIIMGVDYLFDDYDQIHGDYTITWSGRSMSDFDYDGTYQNVLLSDIVPINLIARSVEVETLLDTIEVGDKMILTGYTVDVDIYNGTKYYLNSLVAIDDILVMETTTKESYMSNFQLVIMVVSIGSLAAIGAISITIVGYWLKNKR